MKIARPFRSCAAAALFMLIASVGSAANLSVAVAASMQYVFDDIKAEFEKQTGHEVRAVYNSSGKFVAQIMNGAPFDVFLSADMEYPAYLHSRGFTVDAPKVYAYGALVLWTMKNLDLSQWQTLSTSNGIYKIALANPKTAPYGREAMHVLNYYKLDGKLKSSLVFGESISQTNQYIHSGVVDMGFTAKSVVSSRAMKGQGKWVELPAASYQAIAQGAVMLKRSKAGKESLVQQFYDFLYSPKARAIFKNNGFSLP